MTISLRIGFLDKGGLPNSTCTSRMESLQLKYSLLVLGEQTKLKLFSSNDAQCVSGIDISSVRCRVRHASAAGFKKR